MTPQIKVQPKTKANLDKIKEEQGFTLKSYDQKISFLYWFYETHKKVEKQK